MFYIETNTVSKYTVHAMLHIHISIHNSKIIPCWYYRHNLPKNTLLMLSRWFATSWYFCSILNRILQIVNFIWEHTKRNVSFKFETRTNQLSMANILEMFNEKYFNKKSNDCSYRSGCCSYWWYCIFGANLSSVLFSLTCVVYLYGFNQAEAVPAVIQHIIYQNSVFEPFC